MTVADTIYDTINDNWGNGGYGGATPKIETTETQQSNNIMSTDVITVYHAGQKRNDIQVNDKYADKHYTLYVHVSSRTSAAQSKLLYDEVEYLLRNTTMTGVQLEKLSMVHDETAWKRGEHKVVWTVEVVAMLSDGAVTSAAGTGTGLTGAYIADLLMFGSANAAWVNCPYTAATTAAKIYLSGTVTEFTNPDGTDINLRFDLPLATIKNSLKLYVSGLRIALADADADDYITAAGVFGATYDAQTLLGPDDWTTDRTAPALVTYTWATPADASSYTAVFIRVNCVCTNAADLGIGSVQLQCYYDT